MLEDKLSCSFFVDHDVLQRCFSGFTQYVVPANNNILDKIANPVK